VILVITFGDAGLIACCLGVALGSVPGAVTGRFLRVFLAVCAKGERLVAVPASGWRWCVWPAVASDRDGSSRCRQLEPQPSARSRAAPGSGPYRPARPPEWTPPPPLLQQI